MPHLQLQWLQNSLSYAPEMFINDIIIKGIVSDDNNDDDDDDDRNSNTNKNKGNQKVDCTLEKIIDFNKWDG